MHSYSLETEPSTLSTCSPQPFQFNLPQLGHWIRKHIDSEDTDLTVDEGLHCA